MNLVSDLRPGAWLGPVVSGPGGMAWGLGPTDDVHPGTENTSTVSCRGARGMLN